VAITSNVTATAVGTVQAVVVDVVFVVVVVALVVVPAAVVVPEPDPLVRVVGQAVLVAVLKVPIAEVELH
jgi:hypothetical protein